MVVCLRIKEEMIQPEREKYKEEIVASQRAMNERGKGAMQASLPLLSEIDRQLYVRFHFALMTLAIVIQTRAIL